MTSLKPSLPTFAAGLLLALIALGCGEAGQPAKPVEVGMRIDAVAEAMARGGFKETMLQISSFNPGIGLRLWKVDAGTLIVSYRKSDSVVADMEYTVSTNEPKLKRQTLALKVLRFLPESGEMTTLVTR